MAIAPLKLAPEKSAFSTHSLSSEVSAGKIAIRAMPDKCGGRGRQARQVGGVEGNGWGGGNSSEYGEQERSAHACVLVLLTPPYELRQKLASDNRAEPNCGGMTSLAKRSPQRHNIDDLYSLQVKFRYPLFARSLQESVAQ